MRKFTSKINLKELCASNVFLYNPILVYIEIIDVMEVKVLVLIVLCGENKRETQRWRTGSRRNKLTEVDISF